MYEVFLFAFFRLIFSYIHDFEMLEPVVIHVIQEWGVHELCMTLSPYMYNIHMFKSESLTADRVNGWPKELAPLGVARWGQDYRGYFEDYGGYFSYHGFCAIMMTRKNTPPHSRVEY